MRRTSSGRRGHAAERRARGLSLVELLVALAIGALVVAVAAGLLSSARAGERRLNDEVEPRQALALAAELLREEIALAAFSPWRLAATSADAEALPVLPPASQDLVVSEAGTPSHELRLGFIDDRLSSVQVTRDLSFSAGLDGRGAPQLYRRTGTSSRQPLVAGITTLRLAQFVDASGLHELVTPVSGPTTFPAVWAVVLELSSPSGASQKVLIELPSRPTMVLAP